MIGLLKYTFPFLALRLSFCPTKADAQSIIDKAIQAHGGDAYENSRIAFTFREAYNVRTVNGIRFADYNNYGGADKQRPWEEYDTYFEADTLEKVSEINLEDIDVELLDDKK